MDGMELSNEKGRFLVMNEEGLSFLETIFPNSINLILTDPPYIISRDTGMDKHHKMVEENEKNGITQVQLDF